MMCEASDSEVDGHSYPRVSSISEPDHPSELDEQDKKQAAVNTNGTRPAESNKSDIQSVAVNNADSNMDGKGLGDNQENQVENSDTGVGDLDDQRDVESEQVSNAGLSDQNLHNTNGKQYCEEPEIDHTANDVHEESVPAPQREWNGHPDGDINESHEEDQQRDIGNRNGSGMYN